MNSRIIESLETLEEKIESIKWLIAAPFTFHKKPSISGAVSIIRKSAGILSKNFSKGISFENKSRKAWADNSTKRAQ